MSNISKKIIEMQMKRQQEEALERAKKMVCPQCENTMADVGFITIRFKQLDDKMNGEYCQACYGLFLAKNVPKFVEKKEEKPVTKAKKDVIIGSNA